MIGEEAPTGTYGGGGEILGGIGAIVGAGASIYNTIATNKANKKMAEYQYSKDMEMWNKANEYNSPQMQMQRMEAAGLNPNMVYGSGNVAGNQTGQLPKYNAPRMEYNFQPPDVTRIPAMIMAFQDMKLKSAQYDNLKAQRDAILENTRKSKATADFLEQTMFDRSESERMKAHKLDWERLLTKQKTQMNVQSWPYQLEFIKGRNQFRDTQEAKMIADMKRTQTETEFSKTKQDWYVTQMVSKFGLDLARLIMSGAKGISKAKPTTMLGGGTFNKAAEKRFNETTRRMQDFGPKN